ncbi:hypothetical protein VTK73DRAFT_3463 [Phialemonium thermophilum]|uniref:Uncharacterized protein n=1 Tax=Phialemonium thermophilum TaxID=223376 RepID=A0ABR3VKT1_9PEZI
MMGLRWAEAGDALVRRPFLEPDRSPSSRLALAESIAARLVWTRRLAKTYTRTHGTYNEWRLKNADDKTEAKKKGKKKRNVACLEACFGGFATAWRSRFVVWLRREEGIQLGASLQKFPAEARLSPKRFAKYDLIVMPPILHYGETKSTTPPPFRLARTSQWERYGSQGMGPSTTKNYLTRAALVLWARTLTGYLSAAFLEQMHRTCGVTCVDCEKPLSLQVPT